MTWKLFPKESINRRGFLSFCFNTGKNISILLFLKSLFLPNLVLSQTSSPSPPGSSPSDPDKKEILETEIKDHVTELSTIFDNIAKKFNEELSPDEKKKQQESILTALEAIIRSKGYDIIPPNPPEVLTIQ